MAKLTHDARKDAELIAKRPPLREQSEFAKKSAARRAALKAYFAAHPGETTVSPYKLDEFIAIGTQERFA